MLQLGLPISHYASPIRLSNPSIFPSKSSICSRENLPIITNRNPIRVCVSCAASSYEKKSEDPRLTETPTKSVISRDAKRIQNLLVALRTNEDGKKEEMDRIERKISDLFAVIDVAVEKGVMKMETAINRKSKLTRWKKRVMIHHGWYVPPPPKKKTLLT